MRRALALAWKDSLEFIRDRRSLVLMTVSAFLFPLLGLLVTGLQEQQSVSVAVLVCDEDGEALKLAKRLREALEGLGWVNVSLLRGSVCGPQPGYVVTVAVPEGFTRNITSIGGRAVVIVYKLVGSAAADTLMSIVGSVVSEYSNSVTVARVSLLIEKAGVNASVYNVLHPVEVVEAGVTPTGRPASPETEARAQAARFLAFAVFFVLNPAAVAVADAVARERDAGTGELLAVSPLTGAEFVLGKALGSLAAVAIAGGLDLVAAMVYAETILGAGAGLAALHAAATMLAVFVTVSATMLVTLLMPGRRASSLVASMVTGVAIIVFFTALFIDIESLPLLIRALFYIIPYTYVVTAIKSYAVGYTATAYLHLALVAIESLALLAAAARLYKPSRIVSRG